MSPELDRLLQAALAADDPTDALERLRAAFEQPWERQFRVDVARSLIASNRPRLVFQGAELLVDDRAHRAAALDRLAEALVRVPRDEAPPLRERVLHLAPDVATEVLRRAAPLADADELEWIAAHADRYVDPRLADALILAAARAGDPELIALTCKTAVALLRGAVGARLEAVEVVANTHPELVGLLAEAAAASGNPRTVVAVAGPLARTLVAPDADEAAFAGALHALTSLPSSPARSQGLADGIVRLGPVRSRRVFEAAKAHAATDVARALALRDRSTPPDRLQPLLYSVARLDPGIAADTARRALDRGDVTVRRYACRLLGHLGGPRDLAALRTLSEGFFVARDLKDEAQTAIDAIKVRAERGAGSLSLAGGGELGLEDLPGTLAFED